MAKLADFGESTRLVRADEVELDDALSMSIVGTALYCAPEVLEQQPYDESIASLAPQRPSLAACFRIMRDQHTRDIM